MNFGKLIFIILSITVITFNQVIADDDGNGATVNCVGDGGGSCDPKLPTPGYAATASDYGDDHDPDDECGNGYGDEDYDPDMVVDDEDDSPKTPIFYSYQGGSSRSSGSSSSSSKKKSSKKSDPAVRSMCSCPKDLIGKCNCGTSKKSTPKSNNGPTNPKFNAPLRGGFSTFSIAKGWIRQDIMLAHPVSPRTASVYASLHYLSPAELPEAAQLLDGGWRLSLFEFIYDSGVQGEYKRYVNGSVTTFSQDSQNQNIYKAFGKYYLELIKNADNTFTITYENGLIRTYEAFDANGIARIIGYSNSREGLSRTYTYNQGKLTSVSDNLGGSITFSYNTDGKINQISATGGRNYYIEYNNDRVSKIILKQATATDDEVAYQFFYNAAGYMSRKIRPDGAEVNYIFDSINEKYISAIDGNNTRVTSNRLSDYEYIKTDREGFVTRYQNFSNHPHLWTRKEDALGRVVQRFFDDKGRVVKKTDPCGCGNGVEYAYDSRSNKISKTDNNGFTDYYTYNDGNRIQTHTNKRGKVTSYTYTTDGNYRLLSKTMPLNVTKSYTYNSYGQTLTESNALNNTKTWVYDASAFNTSYTDACNNTTYYTYDNVGRLSTLRDPDGYLRLYKNYDYRDREGRIVGPTGDRDSDGDVDNNDLALAEAAGDYEDFTYDFRGNILTHRDRRGHITTYEYDGQGNCKKVIYPNNSYEEIWRDKNGNIIKERNRNGYYNFNQYDVVGQLKKAFDDTGSTIGEIDSEDNYIEYTYNERGQIIFERDKRGNVTEYVYDNGGRLIEVIDPLNNSTKTQYDVNGNVIKRTDKEGKITNYTYDDCDRLVTVTDHDNNTTTYTYDTANRMATMTNARGIVTAYGYDGEGRMISIVEDYGVGRSNIATLYTYDGRGNKTSEIHDYGTGCLNQTTQYVYDARSNLVQAIDPTGVITEYTYDYNGNVLTKTTRNAASTIVLTSSITYDNMDRAQSTTDPSGTVTYFTYDNNGNILTQNSDYGTGRLNIVTKYEYDSLGRTTKTIADYGTGLNNATAEYTYDVNGNALTMTDPTNRTVTYTYDARNRPVTVADDLGNTTTTVYNKIGAVTEVEDANERSKFTSYDNLHRVSQVLNEMNQPVDYTYDGVGNRLTLTDARSQTTTWTYDALNNPYTMTYPNSDTESYSYTRLGQLYQKTKPDSSVITYTYDAAGRLATVTTTGGTVTYTRDGIGRVTSITSPGGNMSYTYDAAGRLYTVTDGNTGEIITYTYNALGLCATMSAPGSNVVTYGYDRLQNLTSVQKNSDTPATYAYDLTGRRVRLTLPNGVVTGYAYDTAGRLTNVNTVYNGTTYASFAYTLDPTGNRTAITQNLGGVVNTLSYTFDNAYRLTGESRYDANNNLVYAETFAYDAVGNRTNQVKNGVTTTSTYNTANQLVTSTTGTTVKNYTYDLNGNNTSVETWENGVLTGTVTMTYDLHNRQTSWSDGTNTETTTYRGNEWHRSATTVNGTTTNYVYDGDNVVADYSAATLQKFYVTPFLDQNLSMTISSGITGSGTYYYTQDGLGSVRTLTDASSTAQNLHDYTAFGEAYVANTVENVSQRYSFTSRERSEFSSLGAPMYYRWRMYSGISGHFISRDPIGYDQGGPDGNLYAYVQNMPIRFSDPKGLWTPPFKTRTRYDGIVKDTDTFKLEVSTAARIEAQEKAEKALAAKSDDFKSSAETQASAKYPDADCTCGSPSFSPVGSSEKVNIDSEKRVRHFKYSNYPSGWYELQSEYQVSYSVTVTVKYNYVVDCTCCSKSGNTTTTASMKISGDAGSFEGSASKGAYKIVEVFVQNK